jgi:hypothetical protein
MNKVNPTYEKLRSQARQRRERGIVGSDVAQAAAKEVAVPGKGPLENRGEPVSSQAGLNGDRQANYGSINNKQNSERTNHL